MLQSPSPMEFIELPFGYQFIFTISWCAVSLDGEVCLL